MNSQEQFSMILSETLDVLGYNRDVVRMRRWCFDNISELVTVAMRDHNDMDVNVTISGSKREGLAGIKESDTDLMITQNDVQCSDDPASVTRDVNYIFQLDRENCPHGYTKLRLFYRNILKMNPYIENSLLQYPDGNCYLSSSLMVSEIMSAPTVNHSPLSTVLKMSSKPMAGPSTPQKIQLSMFGVDSDYDAVLAFSCQCSEYLESWTNRPRDFDWPSRDQIETAATLDAHVVPVGAKGSEDAHLQWRICYTLTEINLMQSLNETQWKLYVTLKTIRDLVFKPLGDLLTSYVLKNVIMWISESDPIEALQPKYMLHKLQQCLDFLILGFLSKRIPNYMISDRNLLDGRLNDRNIREHLEALNKTRKNLPATILRCTKLKDAMVQVYVAPSAARAEMIQRSNKELMLLYAMVSPQYYSSRVKSCSTLLAVCDCMLQLYTDHPEPMAAALNIPVAQFVYMVQIIKMCPPEIRLKLFQLGA